MSLNENGADNPPRVTPAATVPGRDPGGAWFVYLLECADGTLYCGVTTDLARRLDQHNGLVPGGARYTRARRPVALAAWALADGRSEAQKAECRIRRLPRARKIAALKSLACEVSPGRSRFPTDPDS